MTPLMWAILLLVVALALFALELFIPSGGVLGVLSLAALIGSLVFVIHGQGLLAGTLYLAALAVVIPILLVVALNYWPYTPIGRRILNISPDQDGEPPVPIRHADLLGQRGTAVTKMLPSGAIRIDSRNYDAIAAGGAIEAGDPIEVIGVDGTRIVVQRLETSGAGTYAPTLPTSPPNTPQPQTDPLSRPVSEVVPDPFDDKLT